MLGAEPTNLLVKERAEGVLSTPPPALTTPRMERDMAGQSLTSAAPQAQINVRLTECVYCGAVADTKDHVIPWSYFRGELKSISSRNHHHEGGWMVPACIECNVHLGNNMLLTVPSRAAYLHKRFTAKWRKYTRFPVWNDDDLEGTAGNFRRSVEAIGPIKKYYTDRLEHLKLISELDDDYLRP